MSVVVLSGQELQHVPPAAPSFMVLHSFAGPPTDGSYPLAGLIRDGVGNLYGTTYYGGASRGCYHGCGTVFMLSPTGAYSFTTTPEGAFPDGGLFQDAAGNLYGTAELGGAYGYGVVFQLSPDGCKTAFHSFAGGADGTDPLAGLIRDAAGNLYGTTYYGGAYADGVVFKLSPTGTETVLHSFTGGADGGFPPAGLVQDAAGNLYGATYYGGAYGDGLVFKLSP